MRKFLISSKQRLVATFMMAGALLSFVSNAQACESYQKAKMFCDLELSAHSYPVSIANDYGQLLKLRSRYLVAANEVVLANREQNRSKPQTISNTCKSLVNYMFAGRDFHAAQGKLCAQRAHVCEQRCGGKESALCKIMKSQAELSVQISQNFTDPYEIRTLKECVIKHDVDEEIITASVPYRPLPKRGPIPTSAPARR